MNETFIHLSVPELGDSEWNYVKECMDSGWISSVGPFVERFESALARIVSMPYAIGVVNGTAALHTALLVAGVQAGDEVLVSNLTFISPVNAIRYAGAHPVLMDASMKDWQIDVNKVEQFLSMECEQKGKSLWNKKTGRRVSAIVPVHILGLACEIDRLCDVAQQFSLKVVEDAAEGMGVRYKGKHVGSFGDLGTFSFNGNKVVTAGGGGMIVTRDQKGADYCRYLTTQAKDDPLEYFHKEVGFNYRLTNLHAAIGLAQLEKLAKFLVKKKNIASYYKEALQNIAGLVLMPEPEHCESAFWIYTVLLPEKTTLETRRAFIKKLNGEGIGARPFWHTIHNLPPYAGEVHYRIEHSAALHRRGVCLPSSVGLTDENLNRVVDCFKKIYDHFC